jgi:hypothetical protein
MGRAARQALVEAFRSLRENIENHGMVGLAFESFGVSHRIPESRRRVHPVDA